MSDPAIRRLNHDIHRLHQAQKTRKTDAKELRKDERALKTDRRQLSHHRDTFESDKKELKKDRTGLGKLRDTEKQKLDALAARKADLQEQYDASIDPLTGQGDPLLQGAIDQVTAREAEVHATFDPK